MLLKVSRQEKGDVCTIGRLSVDGVDYCYTLEDPVRPKKIPGKTAIPTGIYTIIVDYSHKFHTNLPRLLNVPNYEGVRIHPGNTAEDTEGCILVGLGKGENSVLDSRKAFAPLMQKINQCVAKREKIQVIVE